jgi:hypothetical protein
VLVIDVLIAVGVVLAWSIFVAPGHPKAYYQTAGIPIAQWSTRIISGSFSTPYGPSILTLSFAP